MELDIPLTNLVALERKVGMPSFEGPFCEQDEMGNSSSHFLQHYHSQVALRRTCADLHRHINDGMLFKD